jgi:hypothetical protein
MIQLAQAGMPDCWSITCRDLQALESELLKLNLEKDELLSEQFKMPTHGGRTMLQRQRKQFLDQRLTDLERSISKMRLAVKRSPYR